MVTNVDKNPDTRKMSREDYLDRIMNDMDFAGFSIKDISDEKAKRERTNSYNAIKNNYASAEDLDTFKSWVKAKFDNLETLVSFGRRADNRLNEFLNKYYNDKIILRIALIFSFVGTILGVFALFKLL